MKRKTQPTELAEQDGAAQENQKPTQEQRMTIFEYEEKYSRRQNSRGARRLLGFLAAVIGILLFAVLFYISFRVWEANDIAGYVTGGVCLLLYILFFLVPLIKILRTGYFITNVNAFNARKAQRHNRKLRRQIADKIIDLTAKVDGVGWYDSETVGKLAIAVRTDDDEQIKKNLTSLYRGSVKKSAKTLIMKSSLKSAAYSALSQTAKIDAVLVVFVNLQLVKDLVYLYGFRPSDARLVRILVTVLHNSLIAYGLGGINVGSSVVQMMGSAVKGIPILGNAIAAIVDSSVQGLVNGTLTTVIGYQTIKYLNKEYRLQNILDGVDVSETEVELEEACADLEKELKNKKKLAQAV